MGEFSISHLLLIAVIFLIFFGPSRLPALGQSLGKAIRGFKNGLNEIETEAKDIPTPAAKSDQLNQAAAATAPAEPQKEEVKQNTNQNS